MIKRYLSKWKNKISLELKRNRRAYIFVSMLFLAGLITGGIYADKIPLDNSSNAYKDFQVFTELYPLQGISKERLFWDIFINNLQVMSFIWISGWYTILLPIGFFQVILKGIRIGFTVFSLWNWYKIKGLLFSVAALSVHNIIYITAIVFFMVYQMKFSLERRQIRKSKNNKNLKRDVYINNLLSTFITAMFLLISALTESYVTSGLLHSLCILVN